MTCLTEAVHCSMHRSVCQGHQIREKNLSTKSVRAATFGACRKEGKLQFFNSRAKINTYIKIRIATEIGKCIGDKRAGTRALAKSSHSVEGQPSSTCVFIEEISACPETQAGRWPYAEEKALKRSTQVKRHPKGGFPSSCLPTKFRIALGPPPRTCIPAFPPTFSETQSAP